ncbi:MAG: NADH-ubiquinone oxidoreductase-F iron-sulfur binding region domain-containing protein [bacterium]|nr:NADH-ubiquinone oxidoreductase-F iron-sulfur binding region domain-containing protein [bacterium]
MINELILTRNVGKVKDIETYLASQGFDALRKSKDLGKEAVIAEIKNSGLRGRGGAGFPTGLKWELARKEKGEPRYLICNADEGEVGTFKDRYLIKNDPYSLIEGLLIAGYVLDTKKSFIYLRGEYRELLDTLKRAIEEARQRGFMADMEIEIRLGAGAYICGEETALMESIEGKRGDIRYKPPFPTQEGLWAKPTVINNVETLMNIPPIILKGSGWFSQIGTNISKGTKVFCACGDLEKALVFEERLGVSLKDILQEYVTPLGEVRMVQIGGASGRIIPKEKLDTPLSFETILGTGGIMVFNSLRDPVDVVKRNIEFFLEESCGKCTPCREGTQILFNLLEKILAGEGLKRDIDSLERISQTMMISSLCGLGQACPNTLMDSLEYFKDCYLERVRG